MRILAVLAFLGLATSVAQASYIQGLSAPAPGNPSGTSASVVSLVNPANNAVDPNADNEDYNGTFAANANRIHLAFSYNDTYLTLPVASINWTGNTVETINTGGAKEYSVRVDVTNMSSVTLNELTFAVTGAPVGPPITFDTATPLAFGPAGTFTNLSSQFLRFNMPGIVGGGGTGSFFFNLDVPDLSDGTFRLSAQVTPEPSSIALALASVGFGGVLIRRRRKQQEASLASVTA